MTSSSASLTKVSDVATVHVSAIRPSFSRQVFFTTFSLLSSLPALVSSSSRKSPIKNGSISESPPKQALGDIADKAFSEEANLSTFPRRLFLHDF